MFVIKTRRCFVRVLFVFLLIFQWGIANANTNADLTFSEAVQKTLEANPVLRQQNFVREKYKLSANNSQLRPQTSLDLSLENFAGDDVFSGMDSSEVVVALSSVFELGSQRNARVKLAQVELDSYQIESQIETLNVLAALTESFVLCLAVQEQILLSTEHVELLTKLVNTVKRQADKGVGAEADLKQAKVALAMAEMNLAALQQEFERRKVALAVFWKSRQLESDKVGGNLFEYNESISFQVLMENFEKSPQMQWLVSQENLQKARLNLIQSQSRSEISWQLGAKRMNEVDETAFVTGVSMPLFSGKRNRSALGIAQINFDQFELEQEKLKSEFYIELFNAFSEREQSIDMVKRLSEEVIPALEIAMQSIQQAYENGRYRYSELLTAQEQLIEAKQMRVNSATQILLNQALIEQLTGIALVE